MKSDLQSKDRYFFELDDLLTPYQRMDWGSFDKPLPVFIVNNC